MADDKRLEAIMDKFDALTENVATAIKEIKQDQAAQAEQLQEVARSKTPRRAGDNQPAPPAQGVDPLTMLELLRDSQERGEKNALLMIERIAGIMNKSHESFLEGMKAQKKLTRETRAELHDETDEAPEDVYDLGEIVGAIKEVLPVLMPKNNGQIVGAHGITQEQAQRLIENATNQNQTQADHGPELPDSTGD